MSKRFSEIRKNLAERIWSRPIGFDPTRLSPHLLHDVGLKIDDVTGKVRRIES